jgi:hypothetical protein
MFITYAPLYQTQLWCQLMALKQPQKALLSFLLTLVPHLDLMARVLFWVDIRHQQRILTLVRCCYQMEEIDAKVPKVSCQSCKCPFW